MCLTTAGCSGLVGVRNRNPDVDPDPVGARKLWRLAAVWLDMSYESLKDRELKSVHAHWNDMAQLQIKDTGFYVSPDDLPYTGWSKDSDDE